MKKTTRKPLRVIAAVCAALVLATALGIGAYALDLGGIRRPVNIWLHGNLTDVTIEQVGEGEFEITYPDGSTRGTGGLAYDANGSARGVTMDEVVDGLLNDVDAERGGDGRIWLYIRDHKIDITNQIEENGYAQEKVKDGLLADYITVVWYGEDGCGIMTSHWSFPSPDEVRQSALVL